MPPPTVTCDLTQPPAQLPPLPAITTPAAQMLPSMDSWATDAMGIYAGEVTIRQREHACMRKLRERGVIR